MADVMTALGEVRVVLRDGQRVWKLRCPGCGQWADMDDDQLHGRVSVDHTDTGCTYHETHDFHAAAVSSLVRAVTADPALRELLEPRP